MINYRSYKIWNGSYNNNIWSEFGNFGESFWYDLEFIFRSDILLRIALRFRSSITDSRIINYCIREIPVIRKILSKKCSRIRGMTVLRSDEWRRFFIQQAGYTNLIIGLQYVKKIAKYKPNVSLCRAYCSCIHLPLHAPRAYIRATCRPIYNLVGVLQVKMVVKNFEFAVKNEKQRKSE